MNAEVHRTVYGLQYTCNHDKQFYFSFNKVTSYKYDVLLIPFHFYSFYFDIRVFNAFYMRRAPVFFNYFSGNQLKFILVDRNCDIKFSIIFVIDSWLFSIIKNSFRMQSSCLTEITYSTTKKNQFLSTLLVWIKNG